jgi:hypothetical protein
MTYLFPIVKIACKPPLKAKELRQELAAYFLSGRREEWQNDCAKRWHAFKKPLCLDIYLTLSTNTEICDEFYLSCSM